LPCTRGACTRVALYEGGLSTVQSTQACELNRTGAKIGTILSVALYECVRITDNIT
jgi:hypothetical protein